MEEHIYTHAAALNKVPTLWCEKQLTAWMVPDKDIQIDKSLYAGHITAREAAINIMTKAGDLSANTNKEQLEKQHSTLVSHDMYWSLMKIVWNACCGD